MASARLRRRAAKLLRRHAAEAVAELGVRRVKLVVSDANEGIRAGVSKVLSATGQRCRVGSDIDAVSAAYEGS